jgi:predicted transcriptional regulator
MLSSKIAELESNVAALERENARLRALLESCSSPASSELNATIVSLNARKLLQWLNNREPESLAAISFYMSIKKTLAADYVEELVRAELLTQISQNSLPDKWALTEIGKQFLNTTH